MIRVVMPWHLRTLAGVEGEVLVELEGTATSGSLMDALERMYPVLKGTIRDHGTKERRAYLRFFACNQDLSFAPADAPLPEAVQSGKDPFMIVGAMSGG